MLKHKNFKHLPFLLLLIAYFVFCAFSYKSFGITDDEYVERNAANDLLSFMAKPSSSLTITSDHYNDSVFDKGGHNPLITKYQRSYQLMQTILNPTPYYEWDHLINLVSASLLFIAIYIIFYINYQSEKKALIGLAFLFLMPRLIGDIPANNKDVPFALMYLVSISAIYIASKVKMNNYLRLIILGIVFGVTQTFRAVGFSIYFVYIIYFIITSLQNKPTPDSKAFTKATMLNFFYELIIIGFMSMFVSILFFPWLGSNFISNISELLLNSQNFQPWNNTIFFEGQFLTKEQRPWYYLFTWLFITTPVFVLALFPAAIVKIKTLAKNPLYLLSIISLVVNLGLYLILQPVIYNGIRHFLFILPAIATIAAIMFIYLLEKLKGNYKKVLILAALLNAGTIIYNYVMLHPYQYVYFNELIGGLNGAKDKYELDYWGATYKEAAEWLASQPDIKEEDFVLTCGQYLSVDYYSKKKFSMLGGDAEPNYSICDYDSQVKRDGAPENTTVIYEIKRMGVPLSTVRKYN